MSKFPSLTAWRSILWLRSFRPASGSPASLSPDPPCAAPPSQPPSTPTASSHPSRFPPPVPVRFPTAPHQSDVRAFVPSFARAIPCGILYPQNTRPAATICIVQAPVPTGGAVPSAAQTPADLLCCRAESHVPPTTAPPAAKQAVSGAIADKSTGCSTDRTPAPVRPSPIWPAPDLNARNRTRS